MKIQLQVRTSVTEKFNWDHQGPQFQLGRSPECALSFQGKVGQLVSSLHARVDLAGAGAFLTDLNSTNGTYVNGNRTTTRVRLKVGDHIHLGQGGPRLEVLAIDIAPPQDQPSSSKLALGHQPQSAPVPSHPPAEQRVSVDVRRQSRIRNNGSNTQMLLSHVQKQNQRSLILIGLLALCALLTLGTVILVISNSQNHDVVRKLGSPATNPKGHAVTPPRNDGDAVQGGNKPTSKGNNSKNHHPTTSVSGPSPPETVLTVDQIVERYKESVVWLGVETPNYRFPVCTGWAATANRVVSTGAFIRALAEHHKPQDGVRVFVYCGRKSDQFLYVNDFKTHPYFNPADPGGAASRHYNIGVVLLKKSLPHPCPFLAPDDLVGSIQEGTDVTALGFSISAEAPEPLDKSNPPLLSHAEGTIHKADVGHKSVDYPRRLLRLNFPRGTEGSPLFNKQGKVVAVLVQVDDKAYGILSAVLLELLK